MLALASTTNNRDYNWKPSLIHKLDNQKTFLLLVTQEVSWISGLMAQTFIMSLHAVPCQVFSVLMGLRCFALCLGMKAVKDILSFTVPLN